VRRRLLSFSLVMLVSCSLAGCWTSSSGQGPLAASSVSQSSASLPHGVMSAVHACRLVLGQHQRTFFEGIERVHLVLTTYATGEPVESGGDISYGMPRHTLVWVVEVHAKTINWNHSVPSGYKPPHKPYTDFSVVMNARTGVGTDSGECRCWPLPLRKVGDLISLPPNC
jgi:hypothetical protein